MVNYKEINKVRIACSEKLANIGDREQANKLRTLSVNQSREHLGGIDFADVLLEAARCTASIDYKKST